jgi:hypothetical protein
VAKKPSQGKTFERRNGQEGFAWEGIATKVDPAGNPPSRPRDLVNIRTQGGVLISRPGFQGDGGYIPLAPVFDPLTADVAENPPFAVIGVLTWIPNWLASHNSAAGVKLWMTSESLIANGNASLGIVDTDADLGIQRVADFQSRTPNTAVPIEKFNNEFYYGDISCLRKLYLIGVEEGGFSPPVDSISDEVIATYPGFETRALQEQDGKLYFAAVNGPSFGHIYSWDGLGVFDEYTMASSGGTGAVMAVYKDTLVVGLRDETAVGQGTLLVRDATGAWTSHTLVGFNVSRFANAMSEYGDLLYIMDGTNQIFTWDGAVIALGHTIPGVGNGLQCCAKLSGRLYFAWTDTLNAWIELGFVDQDNPAPQRYTDVGTRAGALAAPTNEKCDALAQYRGRLWLAVLLGGTTDPAIAWHSQQFMPYDGWQRSGSAIAFTSGTPQIVRITNMRTL